MPLLIHVCGSCKGEFHIPLKTALVNAIAYALDRIREERVFHIVEPCSMSVSLSRSTEKVASSAVISTRSKRHKHGKVTHARGNRFWASVCSEKRETGTLLEIRRAKWQLSNGDSQPWYKCSVSRFRPRMGGAPIRFGHCSCAREGRVAQECRTIPWNVLINESYIHYHPMSRAEGIDHDDRRCGRSLVQGSSSRLTFTADKFGQ